MASANQRPPSPPPPPRRRVKRERVDVIQLEVDKYFRKKNQRRHGKGVCMVPDDILPESSKEAQRRHIPVQDYQELSRADINELHFAAVELFHSDNALGDLSLVSDFAVYSNAFHANPLSQVNALWNFCARRFPNALSLMLVHLLNSPLPAGQRMHAVDLLHLTLNRIHGKDRSCIDERVLRHLKPLLLKAIRNNETVPILLNLSEIAARVFEIETWRELLDYLFDDLHTDFEAKQEMALRILSILPEMREECLGAYKFWWANRKLLKTRLLELFGSPSLNIRALTFDASVKLVRLLHRWTFYSEINDLFSRMIGFLRVFHKAAGLADIVEPRMMELVELARFYTDYFLKRLYAVLECMLEIVWSSDGNTFLKCQAIQIIKILDDQDILQVSEFLHHKLPNEAKRRIFENCVRLMFCIADVPAWYDTETTSSEYTGISGGYELGMFLLFRVCLDSQDEILLSFAFEMIPKYLNSQDWRTRHAGLLALAGTGSSCDSETIRDHAERVLDISLADPHPRVRWAAMEAIICLSKDSDEEGFRYLTKFIPRLVTMIRSTSIYPRIQLNAAKAIRLLITNCGDEVKSCSKDLVPELLNFLKRGEKLREEAMETLKSLAESFPAFFGRYNVQTLDSLKALASQSSCGAKSLEYLNGIIFLGSLPDQPASLINDIRQEVLLIVIRMANNWNETDSRLKIHSLEALCGLCKLPQLVADEFLNIVMPVLIQILESDDPLSIGLKYQEQNSTFPKQIHLACVLLSKFAAQFQEQFAPWASKASHFLTRLFGSSDPDAQITSVRGVLHSCRRRKGSDRLLFNFTVRALIDELQEELDRTMCIEMFKSLNKCIRISGTVFDVDLIKEIANLVNRVLSQKSFANMEIEEGEEAPSCPDESDKEELEEEIIQGAKCLEAMIATLKSAFLTHVDELLPIVEALWGRDNDYPDSVRAAAISIFNLLLKDYPYTLQRYFDTYPGVVTHACYSESPQLQQEGARGIGLCATQKELIPDYDAHVAICSLYHVIECGMESERAKTYDAAVSALGRICEFRRDTIDGPQVIPIWLSLLPLRNDFEEAKYAHQQLCLMLGRFDQDLLGLHNENISKATQVLKEILSQSDSLATEATTSVIIALLSQFGAMD